ncbi:MAG: class I SAM-dependent methyltransferase [Acholeplasma sp.]|nr:MAG: class I SAM-dependent methyltransferase [Acholeplasma sp.]
MQTLFNQLSTHYPKPKPYTPSSNAFWDDEHISKHLLDAHLNPNFEAATRHPSFVKASASWIRSFAKEIQQPKLLDLGCGPGLYAEAFVKEGLNVVGVDFSKRSIAYAKEQTKVNQSNIEYHYQNYLTIEYQTQFDVVTLIYCDYAVLSPSDRKILLKKIHDSLMPQGKFIFDVFTHHQYPNEIETTSRYYEDGPGFWRPSAHLTLERHLMYEDHIRCDEHIVIDQERGVVFYRIWDQSFDPLSITKELKDAGFNNVEIFSDVKGTPWFAESKTMGIVATK